jgi:hypothetical protein
MHSKLINDEIRLFFNHVIGFGYIYENRYFLSKQDLR